MRSPRSQAAAPPISSCSWNTWRPRRWNWACRRRRRASSRCRQPSARPAWRWNPARRRRPCASTSPPPTAPPLRHSRSSRNRVSRPSSPARSLPHATVAGSSPGNPRGTNRHDCLQFHPRPGVRDQHPPRAVHRRRAAPLPDAASAGGFLQPPGPGHDAAHQSAALAAAALHPALAPDRPGVVGPDPGAAARERLGGAVRQRQSLYLFLGTDRLLDGPEAALHPGEPVLLHHPAGSHPELGRPGTQPHGRPAAAAERTSAPARAASAAAHRGHGFLPAAGHLGAGGDRQLFHPARLAHGGMVNRPFWRRDGDALLLTVRVQPGAKKDEITGFEDGVLQLRLRAPAVENQANAALCEYLVELFGTAKTRVKLLKGARGRLKRVEVRGARRGPESLFSPEKTAP